MNGYALIAWDDRNYHGRPKKTPGIKVRAFRKLLKKQGLKWTETHYTKGYVISGSVFTKVRSINLSWSRQSFEEKPLDWSDREMTRFDYGDSTPSPPLK